MRPHPKIRKTVKWGGLILTVGLAAVWVASAWGCVCWQDADEQICVGHGVLCVHVYHGTNPNLGPAGLNTGREDMDLAWWFYLFRYSPPGWEVWVPLWSFILPAALATAAAWRFDSLARRRDRPGLCSSCGYDLRGLSVGNACPECGAAGAVAAAAPLDAPAT